MEALLTNQPKLVHVPFAQQEGHVSCLQPLLIQRLVKPDITVLLEQSVLFQRTIRKVVLGALLDTTVQRDQLHKQLDQVENTAIELDSLNQLEIVRPVTSALDRLKGRIH